MKNNFNISNNTQQEEIKRIFIKVNLNNWDDDKDRDDYLYKLDS